MQQKMLKLMGAPKTPRLTEIESEIIAMCSHLWSTKVLKNLGTNSEHQLSSITEILLSVV